MLLEIMNIKDPPLSRFFEALFPSIKPKGATFF